MEKEIEKLPKKKVDESIGKIKIDIESRVNKIYDVNIGRRVARKLIKLIHEDNTNYSENFSIEDTCIRCGICEKVCPINNITLEDKPIIHDKCIRCGACTHNCPKNAIRYKGEKSRARYRNENVSVTEIIKSNSDSYN